MKHIIIIVLLLFLSFKAHSQKPYIFRGQNYNFELSKNEFIPCPTMHEDGSFAFFHSPNDISYFTLVTYKDHVLIDTIYRISNDTIIGKSFFDGRWFSYSASFLKGKLDSETFLESKKYVRNVNYGKNGCIAEEDFFGFDQLNESPYVKSYEDFFIKRVVYLYSDKKLVYKICVYGLDQLGNADAYLKYNAEGKFIGLIDSKEFYYLQNEKYKNW